jgi:hypothetical protein
MVKVVGAGAVVDAVVDMAMDAVEFHLLLPCVERY